MADRCAICSESDELLYSCNYCPGDHCPDHRLPERHDCSGLKRSETTGKEGQTKRPSDGSGPNPLTGDDIVTFGSVDPEFESSPDVARDGSIAGPRDGSASAANRGLIGRLLAKIRSWF